MVSSQMFKRLLQIAQCGSLTKAADTLFISRPALVQQVKAAEAKLGFCVFDRSARGVTLTPIGKIFLEEGRPIINNYEQLYRKCRSMTDQMPKSVVIGILADTYSSLITLMCRKYKEKYPDVNVTCKQVSYHDFFPAFLSGDFDVVPDYMFNAAEDIIENPAIGILPCAPYHLGICVPGFDTLARLESVGFKDLRGRKLMMHARGAAKVDDILRNYLEAHEPSIEIIDFDFFNEELYFRAEMDNAVLLSVKEFSVFPPTFSFISMDWDFTIERGILYRKDCRPEVKDFIDLIKDEIEKNEL